MPRQSRKRPAAVRPQKVLSFCALARKIAQRTVINEYAVKQVLRELGYTIERQFKYEGVDVVSLPNLVTLKVQDKGQPEEGQRQMKTIEASVSKSIRNWASLEDRVQEPEPQEIPALLDGAE